MSKPTYGRFHMPEPFSALARLHRHDGTTELKVVHHEPRVGVLDQSDLIEQGIIVSTFIPGAPDGVDALGSCTANATTAALSNILTEAQWNQTVTDGYADIKGAEEFAIRFYHECTDQTGNTAQEWPPTDCGSSGQYVVSECQRLHLASTDRIATTPTDIVSLLQTDGVLIGSPFFYAWEDPGADGFIDNGGIEEAIRSGVAGGHETYWWGVDTLVLEANGSVNADKTIIVARNSWSESWGDAGNYRARLSTFQAIAHYCDWRQLVAA